MKPTSPCLDCQRRHAYCHGSCDDYYEYRRALTKYNELERAAGWQEADTYTIETIRKQKRR